jgi:hypothetical protein
VLGRSLYHFRAYLDFGTWNSIGSGAGELAVQLLKMGFFVRIAGAVALLTFGCFTIFLLFGRRRSYPFAWMLFIWSGLAWVALDLPIVIGLPEHTTRDVMADGVDIARVFLSCLVWTAYMVRSKRVSATFVRDAAMPAQPALVTAPVHEVGS